MLPVSFWNTPGKIEKRRRTIDQGTGRKVLEGLKYRGVRFVLLDTSPVGHSQAGGMQESAVLDFKTLCVTLASIRVPLRATSGRETTTANTGEQDFGRPLIMFGRLEKSMRLV